MDDNTIVSRQKSFEELKKINQYGAEYWSELSFCARKPITGGIITLPAPAK